MGEIDRGEALTIHVEVPRERDRSSRRIAVKSFVAGAVVWAAIFYSSLYPSPDRPVLVDHPSQPAAAYGN